MSEIYERWEILQTELSWGIIWGAEYSLDDLVKSSLIKLYFTIKGTYMHPPLIFIYRLFMEFSIFFIIVMLLLIWKSIILLRKEVYSVNRFDIHSIGLLAIKVTILSISYGILIRLVIGNAAHIWDSNIKGCIKTFLLIFPWVNNPEMTYIGSIYWSTCINIIIILWLHHYFIMFKLLYMIYRCGSLKLDLFNLYTLLVLIVWVLCFIVTLIYSFDGSTILDYPEDQHSIMNELDQIYNYRYYSGY